LAQTQSLLKSLLAIPDNYCVLLLQGGAIAENAIVPMNLIGLTGQADYVVSGNWSHKSMQEAARYGRVHLAASSEAQGYTCMPDLASWQLSEKPAYVHFCSNETIGGVECHWTPSTGEVPLVADMSSNIMSRPLDVSRYGLIYAGAQKNMGPSGVTLVIVRRDLMGHALAITSLCTTHRPPMPSTSWAWCCSIFKTKVVYLQCKSAILPSRSCFMTF
jgi:phosphoserine aminotransferase